MGTPVRRQWPLQDTGRPTLNVDTATTPTPIAPIDPDVNLLKSVFNVFMRFSFDVKVRCCGEGLFTAVRSCKIRLNARGPTRECVGTSLYLGRNHLLITDDSSQVIHLNSLEHHAGRSDC